MELVFLWLVAATCVAVIAHLKGRTIWKWFLYGFLIWPVAVIHILVTGSNKTCPQCASDIPRGAKICPRCRTNLAG